MPGLALGVSLARRGFLPVASIVICVLTAIGTVILGVVMAGRGPDAPAHDVPLVASGALAWGGAFLLAFSVAIHALRKDRELGIRALFMTRTTSLRGYLVGRVGGLAALVTMLVGGGTLLTGLVTAVAWAGSGHVLSVLQATFAGVVYAVAFGAVVAPVAFAALGARSRLGGYVFLLAVVTVPELLVVTLGSTLPAPIADVLSIPAALSALRGSLAPGHVELLRTLRALLALGIFVGLASALVGRDARAVDHPEPAP
ncbi:MAG: hypothetical protein JWP97_5290 [Labilithrix sp.]|nr:hypothetical protein [Labilithrix sp.]